MGPGIFVQPLRPEGLSLRAPLSPGEHVLPSSALSLRPPPKTHLRADPPPAGRTTRLAGHSEIGRGSETVGDQGRGKHHWRWGPSTGPSQAGPGKSSSVQFDCTSGPRSPGAQPEGADCKVRSGRRSADLRSIQRRGSGLGVGARRPSPVQHTNRTLLEGQRQGGSGRPDARKGRIWNYGVRYVALLPVYFLFASGVVRRRAKTEGVNTFGFCSVLMLVFALFILLTFGVLCLHPIYDLLTTSLIKKFFSLC